MGRLLYDRILEEAESRNATQLRVSVREPLTEGVAFLERRGFRELARLFQSRLDLTSFEPRRFAGREMPPSGIEVVTLAGEFSRDPNCLPRVHALWEELIQDMPWPDPPTPLPFEVFRGITVENPKAILEAFFLAKDGDAYVGVSNLERMTEEGVARTLITGVLKEYRGRGIALALKLQGIAYALRNGFREIRSENSTLNRPMLELNGKLGFERHPGFVNLGKDLG